LVGDNTDVLRDRVEKIGAGQKGERWLVWDRWVAARPRDRS